MKTKSKKIFLGAVSSILLIGVIGVSTFLLINNNNKNSEYNQIKNTILESANAKYNSRFNTISYINFKDNILSFGLNDSFYILEGNISYDESSFNSLEEVLKDIYQNKSLPEIEGSIYEKYLDAHKVVNIPEVKYYFDNGYTLVKSNNFDYATAGFKSFRNEMFIFSKNGNFTYASSFSELNGTKIDFVNYESDYLINFVKVCL